LTVAVRLRLTDLSDWFHNAQALPAVFLPVFLVQLVQGVQHGTGGNGQISQLQFPMFLAT
jgi:hypothetical protein